MSGTHASKGGLVPSVLANDGGARMRFPFLLVHWKKLSAALAGLLLLSACGASTATSPIAEEEAVAGVAVALTVTVSPAVAERIESIVTGTGTVVAWQAVVVTAETSGVTLTEVLVEEGEEVKKGQVLARLNNVLLKAQVAQQQAVVDESRASVDMAEAADRRSQTLLTTNAVSQETAENARTDLQIAEANLAQAEAALEQLEVQLRRTEILAPVDGYVSEPPAVIGTVVQNGTELFHIIRDGRLELAAKVPEQYLASIRTGQPVTVTDSSGLTVEAEVRAVAAEVDSATRLGTVYVALPESSSFRPGMFGRTAISTHAEMALNVPQSAIVWRDGESHVFVLGADNVVELRAIQTGARSSGQVAVIAGLTADERVVTSGAGFLNDGNTVRVATSESNTSLSNLESVTR
jgi:RND family efflux transporter MFP subunit